MLQLQLIFKRAKSYKIFEFIQYIWKNGRIRKNFPIWFKKDEFILWRKGKRRKGSYLLQFLHETWSLDDLSNLTLVSSRAKD